MSSERLRRGSGESRTCNNQISTMAVLVLQWATHVLHDPNGLLGLSNKLIFGFLYLLLCLGAQLLLLGRLGPLSPLSELEGVALGVCLDRIKRKPGLLNILTSTGREVEVGVQGGVPTGEEAALDLGVLRETSLANALGSECVLLESSSQGILASASVVLVQHLTACQAGAGDGVAEGLGLRFRGRRSDESGLGLGGGGGGGEKGHLFADSTSEVLEALLDVGRVIVGFVVVGRAKLTDVSAICTHLFCPRVEG